MTQQDGETGSGLGPQTPRVSNPDPRAAAGGYKVAIRRTGQSVEITLTSGTEYDSIELYDSLVQAVERGLLRLELKLPRP